MSDVLGAGTPGEGYVERRATAAILVIIGVWLVLLTRLVYLQLVVGDELLISAERNSVRTHRTIATRGMILDRNGEILVDSRPSFDVHVVPSDTPELDRTLARVAALSGADLGDLVARIGTPRGPRRFQALRAAADLDRDALARVEARLFALPGVTSRVRPIRSYPFGASAAHLLGRLGEIGADQLGSRPYQGYRAGDVIGRAGIERTLDRALRGRDGGQNVLVDAHGRELERLEAIEPLPGNNVVLTLDARLQAAAEAGFDELGRNGALVALDPRTGEIRALLSRPAFDPNLFAIGIDEAVWKGYVADPAKPLHNRALQGQYPPGSTYKVVTGLAGREKKVIRPGFEVTCAGSYRLGRRRYRCWKRGGHGTVDLYRALVESCDVFFYQVGRELGVDTLAYYARALGLGQKTGLLPGPESPGLVPTAAWKERRFNEPWIEGETISTSIGQGFNLWTPIQLAAVYAAIGNGGRRLRPYVVDRIEDPYGRVHEQRHPELLAEVAISPDSLEKVRDALRGVVQEPRGTGYAMRNLPDGLVAAGKTGTAQVVSLGSEVPDEEDVPEEHRDHAWFATFVPAKDPELVVAVLVEHGGHGSSAAAPIARRVVEAWLSPPEPEGEPPEGEAEGEGELHARR